MEIPLVLLMGLLVLAGAAWCWGFERRDSWNSAEWDRRRSWQAWHARTFCGSRSYQESAHDLKEPAKPRSLQERSDEQLMAAVQAGDQVALAALVTRHHGPLLGYLYRLVGGDRQLAEDLVQETLLHVLQQRTYQAGRPFKPWLYMIATNLARDYFKSAAVCQRWREGDEEEALLHLEDLEPSPEERVLAAEQGSEVRAALAQLREDYRIVVVLRFYQGFSLQEIAQTLHIPLGTVKSRLSVGVHRLRSVLAPVQKGVD